MSTLVYDLASDYLGLKSNAPKSPSGKTFYVNSSGGSNSFEGVTPQRSFATLVYALTIASANDYIVLLPGHAESVDAAGGFTCSTAGIKIIGLGVGNKRPTLTVGTSDTASTFLINADSVSIENIIFTTGIDALTRVIHVDNGGTRLRINNCRFIEATSIQWTACIDFAHATTGGGKITNNEFISTAAGAASAIKVGAANDDTEISGNRIIGDYSLGGIHNPTSAIATNVLIRNNEIRNVHATAPAINLISAVTGAHAGNNYHSGGANLFGAVAQTGGFGADVKVFTVSIVSSTITTSFQDLTAAVTGSSPWYIENVIVSTDATGLAGGTNFVIGTDNTYGTLSFFSQAVAGLGANTTIDLFTAATTKQRIVLESGKKLQYKSTVGACTGAGVIQVTVVMRRIPFTAVAAVGTGLPTP